MQNSLCFQILLAGDSRMLKNGSVGSSYTQVFYFQKTTAHPECYIHYSSQQKLLDFFPMYVHVTCYYVQTLSLESKYVSVYFPLTIDEKFSGTHTKLCQQFVKLSIIPYIILLGEINGHIIPKILSIRLTPSQ